MDQYTPPTQCVCTGIYYGSTIQSKWETDEKLEHAQSTYMPKTYMHDSCQLLMHVVTKLKSMP
jgi:hypothetical protein